MRAVGPTSLSTTAQSDFVRYCGGAIASGEAASACIVEYRGSANHGLDIGAVRANAAFGGDACVFYFEVDVLSASAGNCNVAVGVVSEGFDCNSQLGSSPSSWAVRGGRKFCFGSDGEEYGETVTTGDVVGCGIVVHSGELFFTKNGRNLGVAYRDVVGELFAAASMHTPGERIQLRFAPPFRFDIGALRREEEERLAADIARQQLPAGTVSSIIREYLLHQGYARTLRCFMGAGAGSANWSVGAPSGDGVVTAPDGVVGGGGGSGVLDGRAGIAVGGAAHSGTVADSAASRAAVSGTASSRAAFRLVSPLVAPSSRSMDVDVEPLQLTPASAAVDWWSPDAFDTLQQSLGVALPCVDDDDGDESCDGMDGGGPSGAGAGVGSATGGGGSGAGGAGGGAGGGTSGRAIGLRGWSTIIAPMRGGNGTSSAARLAGEARGNGANGRNGGGLGSAADGLRPVGSASRSTLSGDDADESAMLAYLLSLDTEGAREAGGDGGRESKQRDESERESKDGDAVQAFIDDDVDGGRSDVDGDADASGNGEGDGDGNGDGDGGAGGGGGAGSGGGGHGGAGASVQIRAPLPRGASVVISPTEGGAVVRQRGRRQYRVRHPLTTGTGADASAVGAGVGVAGVAGTTAGRAAADVTARTLATGPNSLVVSPMAVGVTSRLRRSVAAGSPPPGTESSSSDSDWSRSRPGDVDAATVHAADVKALGWQAIRRVKQATLALRHRLRLLVMAGRPADAAAVLRRRAPVLMSERSPAAVRLLCQEVVEALAVSPLQVAFETAASKLVPLLGSSTQCDAWLKDVMGLFAFASAGDSPATSWLGVTGRDATATYLNNAVLDYGYGLRLRELQLERAATVGARGSSTARGDDGGDDDGDGDIGDGGDGDVPASEPSSARHRWASLLFDRLFSRSRPSPPPAPARSMSMDRGGDGGVRGAAVPRRPHADRGATGPSPRHRGVLHSSAVDAAWRNLTAAPGGVDGDAATHRGAAGRTADLVASGASAGGGGGASVLEALVRHVLTCQLVLRDRTGGCPAAAATSQDMDPL